MLAPDGARITAGDLDCAPSAMRRVTDARAVVDFGTRA